jgi:hypothetical protein
MDRPATEAEMRAIIIALIDQVGGVRSLARAWGITPSYVCDLRNGRREPSDAVCRKFGFRRVVTVTYELDPDFPRTATQ